MSKKNLDVTSIANELQGASLYFSSAAPSSPSTPDTKTQDSPTPLNDSLPTPESTPTMNSENRRIPQDARQVTSKVASKGASMLAYKKVSSANKNSVNSDDIIETIRKTVRQLGKESLFIRFTPGEKQRITSIVFALNDMYRGEGRKTSENEIGRIAVNWLLEDYQTNGKASILVQVLAALNA